MTEQNPEKKPEKPEQPPPAGGSKPAAPKKPAPAAARGTAAEEPRSPMRRLFMVNWLKFAWLAFAAATAAALSTVLRFLYPNVLFEPKSSFTAGRPEDYEIGKVDTRWKEKYNVWIVRTMQGMYALLGICTHLGCTPSWFSGEQKFKCPCHGSGFYKSGVNFEGPAPRPLERVAIGLSEDGEIVIDKSKKFQQEKGEWDNPESFLVL